jgi:hypothetical protein
MPAHRPKSLAAPILLATLLLSAGSCAPAGGPPAGADWIVLFDGSSTDQWRGFRQPAFPDESWTVEDGALKPRVDGPVVDLVTREQFDDYELELEWRVEPLGNAGIFYNVREDHPQVWHTGPEYQVLDDDRHPDGQNPLTSAGSVYGLIAPRDVSLRPVGEYNHARIVVRGPRVEHWLNGAMILDFDLDSQEFREAVARTHFGELPDFARHRGGHVALQHASVSPHRARVWYRNLRIRPL